LRSRGGLTIWISEQAIAAWRAPKTHKRGGPRSYSNLAIETGLTVRMVFHLGLRQTEGFLASLASLLDLAIDIPDHTTLSRRARTLGKIHVARPATNQAIHIMIDSTGLKVHVGQGRKPPRHRDWRKLHLAIDANTGDIAACDLTGKSARDAARMPALLKQIANPLASTSADGAYDTEDVYAAILAHGDGRPTKILIPPKRGAQLSSNPLLNQRNRHVRSLDKHGRRQWEKRSGYSKRSLVENTMDRYKQIIGPELRARSLVGQRVEARIGCKILNVMTGLGMPDSYRVQ
jgi:hypothetical protein